MAKPITEYKNDKLFAIFAGEPGSGKSTAGASFKPPGSKLCVLDFDFRAMGIMDAVKNGWIKEPDNVYVEQFNITKGYEPVNSFLEMRQQYFKSHGKEEYATLQLSSLFEISRMFKLASHKLQKGKMLGNIRMDGPGDFGLEVTGTAQLFDHIKTLRCNVILDAHIVPKWGKFGFDDEGTPVDAWGKELDKDGVAALQYSENHIVGEELNVRAKYASSVMCKFDNIFKFAKTINRKNEVVYTVEFASVFAKNTFGIKPGVHDITGQSFYDYFKKLTGWEG